MKTQKSKLNQKAQQTLLLAVCLFVGIQVVLKFAPLPEAPKFLQERFGSRSFPGVPPVEASIVNWQITNCLKQKRAPELIVFGDSSCLMGVIPKTLEKMTGLRCWNLGTVGYLSTEGHAAVLEQAIDRLGPPKVVVYHIVPYSITMVNEETKTYGTLLKEWLEGEGDSLASSLPSNKLRRVLMGKVSQLCEAFESSRKYYDEQRGVYPSDRQLQAELNENHGWMAERHKQITKDQILTAWFPPFAPSCARGLERMFELADKHQFQVLITMAPVTKELDNPKVQEAYKHYHDILNVMASKHQSVHLIDPWLKFMPDNEFGSINHPTPVGAEIHSKELAGQINAFCDSFRIARRSNHDAS